MLVYIQDLIKDINQRRILEISKLCINEGQHVILTGENGSGKTTLLNIIAGWDKAYTGKMESVPCGYVNQKPYLFTRSVYENLAYPLKRQKINPVQIKQQINEMVAFLKLETILHQRGDKLSGGEAGKVAVARAILSMPPLLLLDEVTANLHPSSTADIETAVLQYQQRGGTTIFVTHSQEQSQRLKGTVVDMANINQKEGAFAWNFLMS